MSEAQPRDPERILLLPYAARDGRLAREVLAEIGLLAEPCPGIGRLCQEIERGAAAALIAEERLDDEGFARLRACLAQQPPWSDFPLLIIGAARARSNNVRASSLSALGNVTLLDTPVRIRTLALAAQAAIRARRRQYMARHAIAQRDRFLAMLGHELRNPLSVISIAVELGNLDPARAASQMPVLQRQVNHLGVLLDDLLDVARVTSGKIVIKHRRIDLGEFVQRLYDRSRSRFEQALLQLRLRPLPAGPNGHVEVDADPVRLEQVVNNLLTNALKYTLPGGEVELSLALVDGCAEIRVTDTGVGISPEILPEVFELFTQAPNSLGRSEGGMGVGLALVRTLVELHGGQVHAHSEGLGRGSSFGVTLPLAASEPTLVGAAALPAPSPAHGPRHILVIEDNGDSRTLLVHALERAGHRVRPAADGESGLELLLREGPDAAIVDIGLPGIDGYEVARQARSARGDELLLIALTGYGLASDRRRALDAGFDVHLTKPPALDRLCALLAG